MSWWQAEQHKYCGRLILLGRFSREPTDKFKAADYHLNAFTLLGDLKMQAEGKFRGIFGWGDREPELTWVAPVERPRTVLTTTFKRKAESASASAPAAAGPQCSSVSKQNKCDELSFPGGFCEVKVFLAKIDKNPSKASYWSKKAQERHNWTEADLKQAPRIKGRKAGGVPPWFASKKVLKQMCKDFF